jgi:hypothetical protein
MHKVKNLTAARLALSDGPMLGAGMECEVATVSARDKRLGVMGWLAITAIQVVEEVVAPKNGKEKK